MRNLSGLVGEYFAKSIERFSNGNLHQDGYPDLLKTNTIHCTKTFDWKAHHRNTNNLLSILWDFIDGIPAIAACFYRNDLTTDDWGKIVQPKSDGGRTTSVSIMTSSGVKKMCDGWIAVIDSEPYISVLSDKKWIGYRVK